MARSPEPLPEEMQELLLHDQTIQALFGLGLRIEYCLALMDEAPGLARAGLETTMSDLDRLIAELRGRIDSIK